MKRWLALVFAVAAGAAWLGIGVRATFGAHVAVDEPQYVLTALSLAEDLDLNIADELAAGRWRDFADQPLPVQTRELPGGRRLSPHDPLLPIVLALPVRLGGWIGAKVAMGLLAGALAALTLWVAVHRYRIRLGTAVPGVALAFASAPFAVYGQQVYPELPAALCVMVVVGGLAGPRPRYWIAGLAIVALPWLSVKYVPVAAVLAVIACVRARRQAAQIIAGLAVTGGLYLLVHRLVWGGWTVYASGDHFQRSGEFGAVGFQPDYVGRGLRLTGLLVDRTYGLVAWQPAWLLILPALAALVRLRPARWELLAAPLLAGWLSAVFLAVTMHGFWWPGRQVVVVLPLALTAVLWWVDALPYRGWAAGLAGVGVLGYAWLLVEGFAYRLTWVVGFENTTYPIYRAIAGLLPSYRLDWSDFWVHHLAWIALFALLALGGWRSIPAPQQRGRSSCSVA